MSNTEENKVNFTPKSVIIETIRQRVESKPDYVKGAEVKKIAEELQIHVSTVYRYLKI